MGAELDNLIRAQQPTAASAALYTIGLDGVRTVCLKWQGPFADAPELLEQVEERALRQANALGGVHAFHFELLDQAGVVLGTEFFRVSAESFSGSSVVSEPANEGGLIAQCMRHTEAAMRVAVLGAEKGLQGAHKLIETANRRAENAETRYLEALNVVAGVMTGERETQVALVKAKSRGDATQAIAGRIATLLPEVTAAVVGHLSGAAPNGAAHAAAIRMKGLMSSLTPAQFQGILGVLNVDQQVALVAAAAAMQAEHDKQLAAEAAKPSAEANGHAQH